MPKEKPPINAVSSDHPEGHVVERAPTDIEQVAVSVHVTSVDGDDLTAFHLDCHGTPDDVAPQLRAIAAWITGKDDAIYEFTRAAESLKEQPEPVVDDNHPPIDLSAPESADDA
jgi:hypothetical protein